MTPQSWDGKGAPEQGEFGGTRVVLLMPFELMRHGVALIVERMGLNVVAQTWSAAKGIVLVGRHAPDLVVVDGDLPDVKATIALLRRASPRSLVLMLADSPSHAKVKIAQDAGADACAFKTDSATDLQTTVRRLLAV